jgi:peptidyl-prolyl cis-trans isomerase D
MLQAIRSKANSFVVKLLFGLLTATFALWGIGDIFRNWGADTTVAKVGSKEITADQVNQALQEQLAQLRNVLGNNMDMAQARQLGLVNAALQQIVSGNLIDLEVNRLGLAIGDDAVRQAIFDNPNFKGPSGNFDRDRYTQLLAANQLTQTQFEASMRQNMVRTQLTGALLDGLSPPPSLVDTLYRTRAERRTADIVTLTPAAIPAPPTPTDEQLAAFHDSHADAFRKPEQRDFTLALLRLDDIAATINIPDDKLKSEYDARRDEFHKTEERNLQQLLLPDEAKAKAAKAALDAGKDFAAVAKDADNADAASTDLGWVKRDDLPPELANVAFALAQGKASDPVQTSFGWHILRVTGIKAEAVQPFDEVKTRLAQEVARDQAGDQIAKTANDIDDALAAGAPFATVVQKFGLKTQPITDIDAQGRSSGGKPVELPTPSDAVLHTAFATDSGQTSPLTELGEDGYFIIHVDKVTPSVVQPLSEAHDLAVSLWQADQQQQALTKLADTIAQEVNSGGKSLKDAAAAHKLTVTTTPPLQRTGGNDTVPPALVVALFGAKQGGAVTAPSGDNYAVAQLKTIEAADPGKDANAVKPVSDEIDKEMRNDILNAFDQALRTHFPVQINQANLDRL